MKRLTLCIFLFFMICAGSNVFSAEYLAGVKAGYYSWRPFYKELDASGMDDIEWGNGVLYGPVLSILFSPDLNFSIGALFGEQSTHWQSEYSYFSPTQEVTGNYYFETFRADVDSALSYRLGENFKIFAGYKFLYLDLKYKYTELRSNTATKAIEEIDIQEINIVTPFHGPALGAGWSLILNSHYFAAVNVSAMYMWGNFNNKKSSFIRYSPPNFDSAYTSNETMEEVPINQLGLNIEPSVGYNPGSGMPVISLGLRYQQLRVEYESETFDDYLLGVFFSVVYML